MTTPTGAAPPRWNPLAIVAFVLAFVVPPGAIACGHIALGQLRASGEQGRGLAIAGTVIGYVLTAFVALFLLVWLGTFAAILFSWLAVVSSAVR